MIKLSGRNKIYLIVFILLLLVSLVFILADQGSTLKLKTSGFAVADVDRITQIHLKEGNKTVLLARDKNVWVINDSYLADQQLMITFLRALGYLRVKNPVPVAHQERIMESLRTEGVEVTIRKKFQSRKILVWYRPNQPTYMLLGNSKSPFVIEVPGLKGEPGELFAADPGFWRENIIFSCSPERIRRVKVDYPGNPDSGFEIKREKEGVFLLIPVSQILKNELYADSLVFRYLTFFSYVPFKFMIDTSRQDLFDPLKNSTPFCTIIVEDMSGQEQSLELHLKRSDENEETIDPDLLYGIFNSRSDLAMVSYVSIDLLLRNASFFFPGTDK